MENAPLASGPLVCLDQCFRAEPKKYSRGQPAQTKAPSDSSEAQARAWLAERRKEHPDLKQVAKGRHLILDSDPADETTAACDMWTLWKSQDDEFEVNGSLKHSDCDLEAESAPYWVELTSRMRPTAFKNFMGDKTSYGCRRTPSKLICEETNDKGVVLRAINDEVISPTELFMLHTFFLAGLTRSSASETGEPAYFTLYVEDKATEIFPISFSKFNAALRLLQRRKYSILNNNWEATEFQLETREPTKTPAHKPSDSGTLPGLENQQPYSPVLKLLVSSNGILLSATVLDTRKEIIRLVQFNKLADF